MLVIKNITGEDLTIDGVFISPGEQLDVGGLSPEMEQAHSEGKLQVKSGDETLEEREADVAAIEEGLA